jgi:hypothetical protein
MKQVLPTFIRIIFTFILLSTFVFGVSLKVLGQTPGLIIKPASAPGNSILDPDGDGYVSKKTNGVQLGFTIPPSNDVTQSEIPFVALVKPDLRGDLLRGPTGGFSEIVGVDAAGNNAILTYTNGTSLFYRFRLSGYAPNSKSYSILIDTDGKMGFTGLSPDPNAIAGNPGFEVEIVLETNFNVKAYNVDGTLSGVEVASYLYDTNCQKSVAVSTDGSDFDYFYDFYLPFTNLPFTSSTPLRYVALTSMNPMPAIGNNAVSDVGGAGADGNLDQVFTDLINAQTPTVPGQEVLDRSDCPMISVPITTNSTFISGSSTEANTTTIKVYKNGTLLGTTTVSSNLWTFNIGSSLLTGDVITATATNTANNEGESIANCNPRTVLAGASPPCIAPAATNLTSDPSGHTLSCTFSGGASYTVGIYNVADNLPFGGTLAIVGTTYTFTGSGSDKLTAWYVRVTGNGCLSSSTTFCGGTFSTTPFITNPVTAGTTSISGTCGTSATVTIFKNDVSQGTATVSGTGWTKTGLTLAFNDVIYVTSSNGSNCMVRSATTTVVCSPSVTPVINENVYAGDNTLTGTCGAGATVTVYKDGLSIGNAIVSGTSWSMVISSLVGNTTTLYVAAIEVGKCEATSSVVTVKTVPVPFISGTYCGSVNSITGFINATNASIQLYKVGSPDIAIGVAASVNSLGGWTISGLSLIGGDQIYAKATFARGSIATSTIKTLGSKTSNPISIVTSPIYEGATTISGTGTNGDVITLYIANSSTTYSASWTGNTWTISSIPGYEFYSGASVYVTATTVGQCESDPSNVKIVQCMAPVIPSYTGGNKSYCVGDEGQLTLASSEIGVIYQLVDGAGVSHGLQYVGTGGAIVLKTSPLLANLSNIFVKAYNILSPSCTAISSVAINFNSPSPSATVTFTSTSLSVVKGITTVSLAYTNPSNTPLADRYTIDYSIADNALGFNDISSPTIIGTSPIVLNVPANPTVGTYNGTITISSSSGGSCSTVYGFSITILPPTGTVPVIVTQPASLNICSNNTATLSVTALGSITGYQWQSSTSLNGSYTNISGATLATYTTTALTATTYYRVIVTNATGSVTSNIATVSVTSIPVSAGTITGSSAVCDSQNGIVYSVGAITNATSYVWTYSGTGAFISGTTNSININFAPNATSGTLSVAGTNSCGTGTAATFGITVNAPPTINTPGTVASVCFSASAQTATMAYTGTTNSPNAYSIDWNSTANAAGLADQGATSFVFSAGAGTLTGIVISANTPSGTYSGTMYLNNVNGCVGTHAVSITVNQTPTVITLSNAVVSGGGSGILPKQCGDYRYYVTADASGPEAGHSYTWNVYAGAGTSGTLLTPGIDYLIDNSNLPYHAASVKITWPGTLTPGTYTIEAIKANATCNTRATQQISLQNNFDLKVEDPGNTCKGQVAGGTPVTITWTVGKICGTTTWGFTYYLFAQNLSSLPVDYLTVNNGTGSFSGIASATKIFNLNVVNGDPYTQTVYPVYREW